MHEYNLKNAKKHGHDNDNLMYNDIVNKYLIQIQNNVYAIEIVLK